MRTPLLSLLAATACSSSPNVAADAAAQLDAPAARDALPDSSASADAGPRLAPTPPTGDALTGLTLFDGWTDPHALAAPVDTTGWEDSAYISANGERLYFAYTQYNYADLQSGMLVTDGPLRPGEIRPGFEIYEATIVGGAWSVIPSTVNATNTTISEASVGVDDAEDTLALVRYDGTPDGDDLYLSKRQGDGWLPSQALPAPVNTACIEDNAALSRDGNTLFFDSNRLDAAGTSCSSDTSALGRTIYSTTWNGSAWSDPVAIVGAPNGGDYHWQVSPRQDPTLYWSGHDSDCMADGCLYHATRQADGTYGDQVLVAEPTASANAVVGQVEDIGEVSITDDGHWMYFIYIVKTDVSDPSAGANLNVGVAYRP